MMELVAVLLRAIVGAADGTVSCLRIHGYDLSPYSDDEQRERLDRALFVDDSLMGGTSEAPIGGASAPGSTGGEVKGKS